jgi:hypothetical protein
VESNFLAIPGVVAGNLRVCSLRPSITVLGAVRFREPSEIFSALPTQALFLLRLLHPTECLLFFVASLRMSHSDAVSLVFSRADLCSLSKLSRINTFGILPGKFENRYENYSQFFERRTVPTVQPAILILHWASEALASV